MRDLLLIHGAIGSASQMKPLADCFSTEFTVHNINLPGHGGMPLPVEFSIPYFAHFVEEYCNDHDLRQVNIFGYSMGGYIALLLGRNHPARFSNIITLGTKFFWDEAIAEKESSMLQPEKIKEKLPKFTADLEARHGKDWPKLLEATTAMLQAMGRSNVLKQEAYQQIQSRVLLMVGDRDKMVSQEETRAVYSSLPLAAMAVLPFTAHPVEQLDPSLALDMVRRFLE